MKMNQASFRENELQNNWKAKHLSCLLLWLPSWNSVPCHSNLLSRLEGVTVHKAFILALLFCFPSQYSCYGLMLQNTACNTMGGWSQQWLTGTLKWRFCHRPHQDAARIGLPQEVDKPEAKGHPVQAMPSPARHSPTGSKQGSQSWVLLTGSINIPGGEQ